MTTLTTRQRKQVIADEAAAEVRESDRIAQIELDRAYDAAEAAASEARREESAEAAKHTFAASLKRFFFGEPA